MKDLEDICLTRVRFSEIDSMRRVWHGAYITFFEDGRESFGRHFPGIGYADMQREGIYAPIYEVKIKYYAPLGINDTAEIHTQYIYKPSARLDYTYRIYRQSDHILCAEGSTTQLFIDRQGELMTECPPYYLEWQTRFLNLSEDEPNQSIPTA